MNLFIFVLALLSASLAGAFSPQPLTHRTTSPSYNLGRLLAGDDDASSSSKERKPWDVFRFVSQSSKFVTPPSLPFIGGGKKGAKRKILPGMCDVVSLGINL